MIIKANQEQELFEHSSAIYELSISILDKLGVDNEDCKITLIKKSLKYACLLHDIGKIDKNFQNFINNLGVKKNIDKKFSFENNPRHNEISYFIFKELLDINEDNLYLSNLVANTILWHHAKPLRKEKISYTDIINNMVGCGLEYYKEEIKAYLQKVNKKYKTKISLKESVLDQIYEINDSEFDSYKIKFSKTYSGNSLNDKYKDDIRQESILSLVKSIVITSDRIVSAYGKSINNNKFCEKIVNDLFKDEKNNELLNSIEKMSLRFNKDENRNKIQREAVSKLVSSKKKIKVLQAPAGSGKTKVSLEYALSINSNKIIYVAPRNTIAKELYDELKSEKYFNKGVSIQIITGESQLFYKNGREKELLEKDLFNADIIVTNIDQLTKTITSHRRINILLEVLVSTVIFDEFHEFFDIDGIDLLFSEIISLKQNIGLGSALLMSATPNYFLLERYLNIGMNSVVSFESSNNSDYNINFHYVDDDLMDYLFDSDLTILKNECVLDNIIYKPYVDKKTIIISNETVDAQKSYMINMNKERSLLVHSKFTVDEKLRLIKKVRDNFSNLDISDYNVVRSGPIIQASMNITSERMITELTTPENMLQRLGRLNRFDDPVVADFNIIIPSVLRDVCELDNKISSSKLTFFKRLNKYNLVVLWFCFLKNNIPADNKKLKISDFYYLYNKFYEELDYRENLNDEFQERLKKSYSAISKNLLDPLDVKNVGKKSEKLGKTIRGSSFYVKMAEYNFNGESLKLGDNYKTLSLSKNYLLLNNDDYYFVNKTKSNLKYIEPNKKGLSRLRKLNEIQFLSLARTVENPIYMSYIFNDLNQLMVEQDDRSYIYLVAEGQDIGYVRINKLKKGE